MSTTATLTVPAAPSVDLIEFMYWLRDDRGYDADDLIRVCEKPHLYSDIYQQYRQEA